MQRQIALAVLFAYGVGLLLLPSAKQVRMKLSVFYPIVVFCTWAFISVFWSNDKALTLKRLVVFLAMVVSIAGVLKHFDWKQIAQIALIGSGLTMLVGGINEARILAVDAPPDLAEVSVQHKVKAEPSAAEPPVGSSVRIGSISVKITGIGPTAWAKMISMGHIVFAFNGGDASDRPGEICVTEVPLAELLAQIKPGAVIAVG